MDGERLRVETSEAYAISLTGAGDWWQSGQERHGTLGEPIKEAEFDLTPFRGSYCRSHRGRSSRQMRLEQPGLALTPPACQHSMLTLPTMSLNAESL